MLFSVVLAAAVWHALSEDFVRVPAPAQDQLKTADFGSRDFHVRLAHGRVEVSTRERSTATQVPFEPAIDTATMGFGGSQPTEAVHIGTNWFLRYDHGEFGGALWRFNSDGSVGQQLLASPTYDLVRYRTSVIAATGSAAPFFFKPLRLHRFDSKNGAWIESSHTDFPYNIVELTNIRDQLYGITNGGSGDRYLAQVDLTGVTRPLWHVPDTPSIANFDLQSNSLAVIGTRGYVIVMHRSANNVTTDWYAPRDCVTYAISQDGNGVDASRCIARPGVAAYNYVTASPPRNYEVSSDGMWLFSAGDQRLWHYVNERWQDVPLPASGTANWMFVDDIGALSIETLHGVWTYKQGAWDRQALDPRCDRVGFDGAGWWCTTRDAGGSLIVAVQPDGHITAVHDPHAPARQLTAGFSNDAWFDIPNEGAIGHVSANGALAVTSLHSPISQMVRSSDAICFTENDTRYYGCIDRAGSIHERTWQDGFPLLGISKANSGAWLWESFPGGRQMIRKIKNDGTYANVYVADVRRAISTDTAIYAISSRWLTILRLSNIGEFSRYRIPCSDPNLTLLPAPGGGAWFISRKARCTGIINDGIIQLIDLPTVVTTRYL